MYTIAGIDATGLEGVEGAGMAGVENAATKLCGRGHGGDRMKSPSSPVSLLSEPVRS